MKHTIVNRLSLGVGAILVAVAGQPRGEARTEALLESGEDWAMASQAAPHPWVAVDDDRDVADRNARHRDRRTRRRSARGPSSEGSRCIDLLR
jgi:hypothetical protein